MTGNRILSIVTILILLFLFTHPIDTDGDFFQHVNIGRYVVTHRTLPQVDDLTFTAAGRPYVGYAWLSGVLFYWVYKTLGAVAINVLVLCIALLTFWLLYRYLRVIGVSDKIAFLTLLFISPVVASRWPTRPEIFMYPIFLGFLLLDEAKKKRPWFIWMYPPLMLLLVNLYGSSFPFAAGLLILLVLKNWLEGERRVQYYTAMALSFPVALVNGYGLRSLLFIFLIPKMTSLWGDWIGLWEIIRRPEINYPRQVSLIYCTFFLYVVTLSIISSKKVIKFPFQAIIAITVIFPFVAVRMRALAALCAAPLVGLLLSRMQSKWIRILTVLIAVGLTGICFYTNPMQIGEDTVVFPPKLIQFIQTNDLTGNVFNTPRIGSFLAYHLAPQVRVFSDTRDDLFIGTGVLEVTGAFLSRGASVLHLLEKYHVSLVVVNLSDGPSFRDLVYDSEWSLVYFDGNYLIFIPKSVAEAKHIPVFATLDPYAPDGMKH